MMRRLAIGLAVVCGLLFAACSQGEPSGRPRATPAIWEIRGANGALGWLFGTVHKLPGDSDWRSERLKHALASADMLVVETRDVNDRARLRAIFQRLARSTRKPPLAQRVDPGERAALMALLRENGLSEGDFSNTDTWAAALTLSKAASGGGDDGGVDGALMSMDGPAQVVELEGTEAQLGLFDRLPERDQRDLLGAVAVEGAQAREKSRKLTDLWAKGDMAAIERETHRGILADPELRDRLLLGRNRAWAGKIDQMLRAGQRPFVAAGAAHMAGDDGLPALLAARGWQIQRIQ